MDHSLHNCHVSRIELDKINLIILNYELSTLYYTKKIKLFSIKTELYHFQVQLKKIEPFMFTVQLTS